MKQHNMHIPFLPVAFFILVPCHLSCQTATTTAQDCTEEQPNASQHIRNTAGTTTETRFRPPAGYSRTAADSASFAYFLRNFPLKQDAVAVHHHDGTVKDPSYHAAVLNLSTGTENLQQCADAVMRMRAEFFYSQQAYRKMHFNFTNGFRCGFDRWSQGCRVKVQGNQTSWVCGQAPATDRKAFQAWMNQVFMFAGTLSLEQELLKVPATSLQPGDVWIKGGSPGHAVLVMDMCHDSGGNKLFLLAQSYMPAQDMHILENVHEPAIGPWFRIPETGKELYTPEWTFAYGQLRRFKDTP